LTGTCYNFEMEEFFSSFLRRAGMPASAGLSCLTISSLLPQTCLVLGSASRYRNCLGLSLGLSLASYQCSLPRPCLCLGLKKCLDYIIASTRLNNTDRQNNACSQQF